MSWLGSMAAALLAGVLGCVGAGGIGLLCVEWYRIPSREGASGYFVVFMGLLGAVGGLVLGLILARVGYALWGPGLLWQGLAAASGVLSILTVVLLGCWWFRMPDAPPAGEQLDFLVEVRLPEGLTDFPAKDAAEAYISLAMLEGRNRLLRGEAQGAIDVARARLEHGRWLVPGRAPFVRGKGDLMMTIRVGPGDAERFLLPPEAGRKVTQGWSEWIPRSRPDGAPPIHSMTFRYQVRRAADRKE